MNELNYNSNSQYATFYVEIKACYNDLIQVCTYNLALQAQFRSAVSN
jgi:hypothetical protein